MGFSFGNESFIKLFVFLLLLLKTPLLFLTCFLLSHSLLIFLFFFLFFFFLELHPRHMELPRRGVKLELQLPAYATATEMQDPSHVCDLHTAHSNARSLTH